MKKMQRKILCLLLCCVMGCVPAAQVMAATSYEAFAVSASEQKTVLFPGDSLTGIADGTVITITNEEGTLSAENGTWTNPSDKDTAYQVTYTDAVVAEDGSVASPAAICLTPAGYILTVAGGTSVSAWMSDQGATTNNHYSFTDEEKAAMTDAASSKDIAYYQSGETVTITAAEPDEGYEFAEWVIDSEDDVAIADPASAETTITMPGTKMTVTASYQEIVEEVTEAAETEESAAAAESGSEDAGSSAQESTAATEESAETGADNTAEITTSDSSDVVVVGQENTASADVQPDTGSSDTTAETSADTSADAEVVVIGDDAASTTDITYVTLTVNYDIGADGYVKTETNTYAEGDTVTLIAEELEGYTFSSWYVASLNVALEDMTQQTVTFTMPSADVTILASYAAAETETAAAADATDSTDGIVVIDVTNEITATETETETETIVTETGTTATESETETETAATETETETTATVVIETETETAATETETETTATESETAAATYAVTVDGTLVGNYAVGDTVTVAQPAASTGTVFSSWMITNDAAITLSAAGDGTWTFTMPAGEVSLASIFDVATYTVTVVNGTTGSGATTGTFEYGSTVSIAAETAPEGMEFDHWSNTGSTEVTFVNEDSATTTFTMPDGDVEVTAVYVSLPNTYTVKVSNGLLDGSYTEHSYEEGTQVTVTANASANGEEFSGWTVNDGAYDLGDDATSSTVTVTVTENLSFVANYTGVTYNVTLTNGTADYTESVAGSVVTITAAEPAAGYAFDYWTVDTQNVTLTDASASTTTFTMPSADVALTAVYKQVQYTVTVENGSASQTYYYYGDTVTITANYPASGKEFSSWTATSGNVTFADASRATTTFTMPASNVTVSATYEDGPTASDNYISGITSGGSYAANEKLTFTPVGAGMSNTDPNPGDIRFVPTGYSIGNVSNTWSSSPYETSMSIKSTGEYTLSVTFARQVYDGSSWVADGTTSTTSVTFNIVTSLESVDTGDSTPLFAVAAVAVVACLIFVIVLVVFIRKRRSER
ncbi:MAG: InlB B-repeat-containing protein [Lachnospiraceae bacterium]|nr:InlB B-repeat-containing protein [Lachnospiraceae bacterium]